MPLREVVTDALDYVSSVVRRPRDYKREISDLYEILRNIEDVKGLEAHPGWVKVRGALLASVHDWRQQVYDLAALDPIDNADRIRNLTSQVKAATELLAIIETTLAAESGILNKLKKLEETIRQSSLQ